MASNHIGILSFVCSFLLLSPFWHETNQVNAEINSTASGHQQTNKESKDSDGDGFLSEENLQLSKEGRINVTLDGVTPLQINSNYRGDPGCFNVKACGKAFGDKERGICVQTNKYGWNLMYKDIDFSAPMKTGLCESDCGCGCFKEKKCMDKKCVSIPKKKIHRECIKDGVVVDPNLFNTGRRCKKRKDCHCYQNCKKKKKCTKAGGKCLGSAPTWPYRVKGRCDKKKKCKCYIRTTQLCSQPSAPSKGQWYCIDKPVASLTCTLECDLGYIHNMSPTTVCNRGVWTVDISLFQCRVAVALLTGGATSGSVASTKVETYSPYGQCSQVLPDMPAPRYGHSLNLVGDQIILCGGGFNAKPTCFQMNMDTFMWTDHSNALDKHLHHNGMVHQESLILLGGQLKNNIETDEIWDGSSWKYYNTTPHFLNYGACTAKVTRNTYIVMGGLRTPKRVLMYNLKTSTVTQLPDLLMGRVYQACTFIKNATFTGVLLSGQGNSELYNLSSNTSILVGNLNFPRQGHTMMVLGDKIVAMGGRAWKFQEFLKSVEEFDMATQIWSLSQYELKYVRWYAKAIAIQGPANTCCNCFS